MEFYCYKISRFVNLSAKDATMKDSALGKVLHADKFLTYQTNIFDLAVAQQGGG